MLLEIRPAKWPRHPWNTPRLPRGKPSAFHGPQGGPGHPNALGWPPTSRALPNRHHPSSPSARFRHSTSATCCNGSSWPARASATPPGTRGGRRSTAGCRMSSPSHRSRRARRPAASTYSERRSVTRWLHGWGPQPPGSPPRPVMPENFEGVHPSRRRIPTVNVAVAMTVPTSQRISRVSRLAISVRTPAISVESRVSRFAISARISARPARN